MLAKFAPLALALAAFALVPEIVWAEEWVTVEQGAKLPKKAFSQRIKGSGGKKIAYCMVQGTKGEQIIGTVRSDQGYCEFVKVESSEVLESFESLPVHRDTTFKVLTLGPNERVQWANQQKSNGIPDGALPCPGGEGAPFASCFIGRSLSSDEICLAGLGKVMLKPYQEYHQVHMVRKGEHHLCPFFMFMTIVVSS